MLAPVHRIRASSTKSIRKLRANSRSLSAVVGTGVPAASAPGSGTDATSVPQILDGMERRGERRSGPAFDNLVLEGMCSFYRISVHVCRQSASHVRHVGGEIRSARRWSRKSQGALQEPLGTPAASDEEP